MTKRRFTAVLLIAMLAVLALLPTVFYLKANERVEKTAFALDTIIKITVTGKNAGEAANKAIAEVNRIDRLMSAHRPDSDIYAVNSAKPGDETPVSEEVFKLLEAAADIWAKTDGAFDITLKPLSDLWNIKAESPRVPTDEEIASALEKTGCENMVLNKSRRTVSFKKEGMGIDLGAIAKGYAADRAARILKKSGIENALIDLGGNVYALGKKPHGGKWKIGLQTPWRARGEYFKIIDAENLAVVTSGAYERYFKKDGKTYHHILSPQTGRPAESGIDSVTVISGDSALADALSTAVFVLGRDRAEAVLESFDGVRVVILENDGREYVIEN